MRLNNKKLVHIPLLEGEEQIECLSLYKNFISKIENLVSLPYLYFLDISFNRV